MPSVFDIDWQRDGGRLVVPTLGRPLAEVLADGACVRGERRPPRRRPTLPGWRQERRDASAGETLGRQHYRPAYWRTGETEGNYRRFFDIGSLIGVRVEDPEVFARTHRRMLAIS